MNPLESAEVIEAGGPRPQEPPPSFWNRWLGLSLRWLAFIPLTILGMYVAFPFSRVLIGFIGGGEFRGDFLMIWVGYCFTLHFAVVLGVGIVCPRPHIGVVIFATLAALFAILLSIAMFADGVGVRRWVEHILITGASASGLYHVWDRADRPDLMLDD